ncbi:hypothetical protein X975_17203, partial [Stegodyphus mimosarum]
MAELSDSELPNDWTIIPSTNEAPEEQSQDISLSSSSMSVVENDDTVKNSGVEDLEEHQENLVPTHKEHIIQSDSSSSSDVDIIDENPEDTPASLSHPSSDLQISSSVETSSRQDSSDRAQTGRPRLIFDAHMSIGNTRRNGEGCLIVGPWKVLFLAISLPLIAVTLACIHTKFKDIRNNRDVVVIQLKDLVKELKFEKKDLKNQMISEIQNDKIFPALEAQIKELKEENLKLGDMLQDVILELQKQTTSYEKEFEKKGMASQELFKNEINKLKEQINILQFDNEELQKQLVRMRYGRYPYQSQDDSTNQDGDKIETAGGKTKPQNEENGDNSSEILTEEIRKLRSDLHSEILKLKNWNELVEVLKKEFLKSTEDDESNFESDETNYGDEKQTKNKKHYDQKRKNYDWSWKDLKKKFKGSIKNFPNINISEMFTKYMKYNKKMVEDVFKSFGHHFRKAQEETQKILKSHTSEDARKDMEYDIWSTFGDLGKKLSEMKNGFFKMDNKNYRSHEGKHDDVPEFQENYYDFHRSGGENTKLRKPSGQYKYDNQAFRNQVPDGKNRPFPKTPDDFNEENNDWYFKRANKERGHSENLDQDQNSKSNSWVFDRAAYRANVRQNTEEMPINWYLRRKKDNNFDQMNEDESRDELILDY